MGKVFISNMSRHDYNHNRVKMKKHRTTSFSWLEPMLSMAMGLLGALFPAEVMSCSVRMHGDGGTVPD